MSKDNPELWEVVLMLRRTEVEIQEFATDVTNRYHQKWTMNINDLNVIQRYNKTFYSNL